MTEYQAETYSCFNDCFCRRIRPECRPIDRDDTHFIAPCDGLLSAYKIEKGLVIPVKQSSYSIESLLRDKNLADEFDGGYCLVYRLCVNHYHRYCYPDDGSKGENNFIPGVLHTVRPIALETLPVFIENSREYTVLDSSNFGRLIQMEVGAMLVGKISNNEGSCSFKRGQEKGKFLYGGSTIIVLVKKDVINLNSSYFETPVKLGQCVGIRIQS